MARGLDIWGYWGHGDHRKTRHQCSGGGPHIFILKHAGSRSGLWSCTAPLLTGTSPWKHWALASWQPKLWGFEPLVLCKFKWRGGTQTCYSMGLLDTDSLMGCGGSWVLSHNLDVGKVPAWQLGALHDLNSSRCPSPRSSKQPQCLNKPQAAAGAGGKLWSSTAWSCTVLPSSLQIIFLWAKAQAESEQRAQPQVGLISLFLSLSHPCKILVVVW